MALTLHINGQNRVFDELASPASLLKVVEEMGLKADRIAVEHNGEIAPRVSWPDVPLSSGDRLEIVHFVGGGSKLRKGVRAGSVTAPNAERGIVGASLLAWSLTIHNIRYRTWLRRQAELRPYFK